MVAASGSAARRGSVEARIAVSVMFTACFNWLRPWHRAGSGCQRKYMVDDMMVGLGLSAVGRTLSSALLRLLMGLETWASTSRI